MDGHWSRSEIVILKPNSRGTEGSVVGSRGASSSVGHNQSPEEPVEAMVILSTWNTHIPCPYHSISHWDPFRSWCSASDLLREIDLRCEVWWFSQGTKGPVKSLNMCHLLWHWYSIDLCSKVPKLALTESLQRSPSALEQPRLSDPKNGVDPSREAAGVQADAVALFSTTCQGLVPDAGHSWGTWCDTQLCGLGRLQSSPQYRLCVYIYMYVYNMYIYIIYIYTSIHIYIYYNILYMYLYQSES